MTEQTAENFIFYNSFYEAIREFDDEKRLELYDAIMEFAFDNIEKEFVGMQNAVFSLIKPLISASIKNYRNGAKGGRPKQTTSKGDKTPQECKFALDSVEVENFIADFKTYKNADFEPTTAERKNIAIVLSELDGYEPSYWQKVFTRAKAGYLIDGQKVPCNLRKILLEHNSIYAGEANLAPNEEQIQKIKQAKKDRKEAEEKIYAEEAEQERQIREQERAEIRTADQAVEFLNKYVLGNTTMKRISSDFKEFSKLFGIEIDKDGKFYVYDTSE